MPKKILKGRVICDKTNKTINVLVTSKVLHPIYKKYISANRKFLVHDEYNKYKPGDVISIQESRPISKRKRWVVIQKKNRCV